MITNMKMIYQFIINAFHNKRYSQYDTLNNCTKKIIKEYKRLHVILMSKLPYFDSYY